MSDELKTRIEKIEPLVKDLIKQKTIQDKVSILDAFLEVNEELIKPKDFDEIIEKSTLESELVLKSIIAIGEAPIILRGVNLETVDGDACLKLISTLLDIEKFYDTIGGMIGYHLQILKAIYENENPSIGPQDKIQYLHPVGIDISQDTLRTRKSIVEGIKNLKSIAAIYPLGGAGDRLGLKDENTHEMLPAALLKFSGKTLLESIISDLSCLEYLYYKLYGRDVRVPIVIMTSNEKDNRKHILEVCAQNQWFGRHRNDFLFFNQPLAPVISKEGHWCLSNPMTLVLKPGGHGVIWKLAIDNGIFEDLKKRGLKKALVRQINNPVAGIDHGILSLMGEGWMGNKSFGFASCHRRINSSEGMNVLIEKRTKKSFKCCISNIEYTEFTKRGIEDIPCKEGSIYSAFPANTNILFVDLISIENAVKKNPIPNPVVNMKTKSTFIDERGERKEIEAGRLETTMQNIADEIVDELSHEIRSDEFEHLKTYITYNTRQKTISVTKNSYVPGKSPYETPESCFYDLLSNMYELLKNRCKMQLPPMNSLEEYLKEGPPFIFSYHPSLGPLWEIIEQKIRNGSLAKQTEVKLEIAELDLKDVEIDGSLHIKASAIMGERSTQEILTYSERSGKCELINVKICNRGMDPKQSIPYWKNDYSQQECMTVHLKGCAEFYAKDVTFQGNWHIDVPDSTRVIAYEEGGKVLLKSERIQEPTWYWKYHVDKDFRVVLEKYKTK